MGRWNARLVVQGLRAEANSVRIEAERLLRMAEDMDRRAARLDECFDDLGIAPLDAHYAVEKRAVVVP